MNSILPYTELLPGTSEHLDFVTEALKTRNFAHLAALKNRTDKVIHLVHNWFYYTIIKVDNPEDVVIIYSDQDRETIDRIVK